MGVFEYLGVLLSVIVGLGVTHILAGISKLVHHRRTLGFYWVHALWCLNILIYIVIIWWGMFWWSSQLDWSFFQFLMLILYAIVLFLAASLLFPWDFPAEFDFEAHFYETRPWFFSVVAIAWLIDIPETVLKSEIGVRDLPQAYLVFVTVHIILSVIGIFWADKVYHKAFAVFMPIFTIGYLSVTTLAEIAT